MSEGFRDKLKHGDTQPQTQLSIQSQILKALGVNPRIYKNNTIVDSLLAPILIEIKTYKYGRGKTVTFEQMIEAIQQSEEYAYSMNELRTNIENRLNNVSDNSIKLNGAGQNYSLVVDETGGIRIKYVSWYDNYYGWTNKIISVNESGLIEYRIHNFYVKENNRVESIGSQFKVFDARGRELKDEKIGHMDLNSVDTSFMCNESHELYERDPQESILIKCTDMLEYYGRGPIYRILQSRDSKSLLDTRDEIFHSREEALDFIKTLNLDVQEIH